MKNVQIIDAAENATFSIFQATDEEFARIFPRGRDLEFAEDFFKRVGSKIARQTLEPMWVRPIRKSDALGVHGTLFYNWIDRKKNYPRSKREIDMPTLAINQAQRDYFLSLGGKPMPKKL